MDNITIPTAAIKGCETVMKNEGFSMNYNVDASTYNNVASMNITMTFTKSIKQEDNE